MPSRNTNLPSEAAGGSRLAAPTICQCPEPPARGEDWPDNMHLHEGCRVYHRFKDCAIGGQGELPL